MQCLCMSSKFTGFYNDVFEEGVGERVHATPGVLRPPGLENNRYVSNSKIH